MGRTSELQRLQANFQLLQAGDHIFVCRASGYSHHGIYVGGVKYAIHLTSAENKNSVSSGSSVWSRAEKCGCLLCGYKPNMKFGVIKTCLDCFVSGDSLIVKYHRNPKPCDEVVDTASQLLERGFGNYDLVANNCEHFATFCKTGKRHSGQVERVVRLVPRSPHDPLATVIRGFQKRKMVPKLSENAVIGKNEDKRS